jgi:hypothetical protein
MDQAENICTYTAHADSRNAMRRDLIVFDLRTVGFLRPAIADGYGQIGQEPCG